MNGLIRYLNKVKIIKGIMSHTLVCFCFQRRTIDSSCKSEDMYGNETI